MQMQKIRSLKFYSTKSLAKYLGISEDFLLLIKQKYENYYYLKPGIKIKDKLRDFYIPCNGLGTILEKIDKKILNRFAFRKPFQGAIKGRTLRGNAQIHVGAKEILKIDIKNFFPSITPGSVRRAFLQMGMSYECADILATVVTVPRPIPHLPQGFTTSPKIAALVLSVFEEKIHELCKKYGWLYTIWVDDVTFSSREANLPVGKFKNLIIKLLHVCGFQINLKKLKRTTNKGRMVVNSVVVNVKPNIPKENKKRIQRYLYQLKKVGPKAFLSMKKIRVSEVNIQKLKDRILGRISYIFSINEVLGSKLKIQFDQISWNA